MSNQVDSGGCGGGGAIVFGIFLVVIGGIIMVTGFSNGLWKLGFYILFMGCIIVSAAFSSS